MSKVICWAIGTFLFVTFGSWLGGLDFNERGHPLAIWFFFSSFFSTLVAGFIWDMNN